MTRKTGRSKIVITAADIELIVPEHMKATDWADLVEVIRAAFGRRASAVPAKMREAPRP